MNGYAWTALLAMASMMPVGGAAATREFDLVVYGATSGGVIMAARAAKEGLKVALVEPGRHLGGMSSGGLGRTDHGRKETIGGDSLDFYRRVAAQYGKAILWDFEPHVAEKVFRELMSESKVEVFFGHSLKEKGGVKKQGARIVEIATANGAVFRAKVFADCTYEGDLMAQAKVSYTVGREGTSEYGESLAGVRPKDRNHQFDVKIPARDEQGRLLAEIQSGPRGEIGQADRKVQAYNFRMCLSSDRNNQVPFARPAGYDPRRYELLARLITELAKVRGRAVRFNDLVINSPMPNNKTDINNRGAFSTDYIGKSWDYPEANYKRRAEIWKDHVEYTQGFFYFLANDPKVPEDLRREVSGWGLAKDEFQDTGHWPHQLYVREARRLVGDFVMTQKDLQTERTKPDAIGMGSYNSDSHNVQRFVEADGSVQNEGNMEVPVQPYQIPYRVLLPKKGEAENLLVPVCMSSSHVSYSTLRMEPVYMILGQAAGIAARMAARSGKAVQEIDVAALQAALRQQGAVFEASAPATPAAEAPRVVVETELGEIEIAVDTRRAPATAANFLRYARSGFYDGGRFHRVVRLNNDPQQPVKIEVVQADIAPAMQEKRSAPIALERTRDTGLKHLMWTVSMARAAADSATSSFFICLADEPELDFGGKRNADGQGFAAFGRVVRGQEVVRAIHRSPAEGQALKPSIGIRRVSVKP